MFVKIIFVNNTTIATKLQCFVKVLLQQIAHFTSSYPGSKNRQDESLTTRARSTVSSPVESFKPVGSTKAATSSDDAHASQPDRDAKKQGEEKGRWWKRKGMTEGWRKAQDEPGGSPISSFNKIPRERWPTPNAESRRHIENSSCFLLPPFFPHPSYFPSTFRLLFPFSSFECTR